MMSLVILHRLASMTCSSSQEKFPNTTPDSLQLVIFIGNTLNKILTKTSLASIGAKIWNSEHYGPVI